MKKTKRGNAWQKWIAMLIMMCIGAACGFLMGVFLEHLPPDAAPSRRIFAFALLLLGFYAAMGLQIIVHEAGHLVFGLLTGYRFSSFRIGSMIWLKENGRLVRKTYSLAGTGGQCLMSPPDPDANGMIPVVLYNLGGSLLNLVFSALCLGLFFLCRPLPVLSVCFAVMALVGTGIALTNGVPLRMGTVDNDGYNALSLRKDPAAVRAFWLQMKMNDSIARGMRPKDMPDEWFAFPDDEHMKNSLVAAVAVMACSRLIDQHRFVEADAQIERILALDSGVIGLHRVQLVCERAFCELIGPNRRDVIDNMLTKEQKKMMKAMKTMPSVLRLEYALALLLDRDADKAEKALARFEKIAAKYPYPADIESERELIAVARRAAAASEA